MLTENRDYKASRVHQAARVLARLRTGEVEDAEALLEDDMDQFLVGVPMGQSYPELPDRYKDALAVAKVYRSRFPFPGGCKWHGDVLHFEHVPGFLNEVPMPGTDDKLLEPSMKKIRQMSAAPTTQGE
jgi:hypothetical protein